MLGHETPAGLGQLPPAAARAVRQPGALEPVMRPAGAVLVDELRAARQQLLARCGVQLERVGRGLVRLAGGCALGPAGEKAQQRLDEAVVGRQRGRCCRRQAASLPAGAVVSIPTASLCVSRSASRARAAGFFDPGEGSSLGSGRGRGESVTA